MRRTFRRQIRQAMAQDVPPILQEANIALNKGEYGRAAELFEQIAHAADGRGGPRAPLFYLQAGHARVLARQGLLGVPSIKRGLELLAERHQYQKLHQAGTRAMAELKSYGLAEEAAEIQTWLKSILPEVPTTQLPVKRPILPTHCPHCGAPVRPDEVEWLDSITAECGYCGSPVR
ncbi:MAG: hypothetical protein IPP66_13120 [Anaerolineales bacterium]|nr:hypothetical protein [Anaerolineales bacterium]